MTDPDFFPVWLTELEFGFWLLQGIALLVAAVLFFRADRRHHSVIFLIGSSLVFLLVAWQTLESSFLISLTSQAPAVEASVPFSYFQPYENLRSCLGILANGFTAYGIVVIALIAFRKSRMPAFDRESTESGES